MSAPVTFIRHEVDPDCGVTWNKNEDGMIDIYDDGDWIWTYKDVEEAYDDYMCGQPMWKLIEDEAYRREEELCHCNYLEHACVGPCPSPETLETAARQTGE